MKYLLKFSHNVLGMFDTIDAAEKYLTKKYGEQNVKNNGQYTPTTWVKQNSNSKTLTEIPNSRRGKCIAFEVKSEEFGCTCLTKYDLEEVEVLG